MMGFVAALWGVMGICVIFGGAIYRLADIGMDAFSYPLSWYHWCVLVVWVLFMAHAEGYRGFQKGFSPRVAARVAYLKANPTPLWLVLAPLFCMGFFYIERRRQVVTYCLTLAIIVLVIIIPYLAQPWRGIVDLGVVVGLAWGIVSLLIFTMQALTDKSFSHSPEIPVTDKR
jgi:hypothetical protein